MIITKTYSIFNGNEFNKDFHHNSYCECPYCFLGFPHLHKEGTNLNQFDRITPKEESWEERFDKEFPFGSFAGSATKASEIKDFIFREFIDIKL